MLKSKSSFVNEKEKHDTTSFCSLFHFLKSGFTVFEFFSQDVLKMIAEHLDSSDFSLYGVRKDPPCLQKLWDTFARVISACGVSSTLTVVFTVINTGWRSVNSVGRRVVVVLLMNRVSFQLSVRFTGCTWSVQRVHSGKQQMDEYTRTNA